MTVIDLAIQQVDSGFDIILDNGDLVGIDSFDSSILMSLFNDQRADASEVPTSHLRRGWWGNVVLDFTDFQVGSKLWLLKQARRTQDTLNIAADYTKKALAWMVEDGYATKIEVTPSFIKDGIKIDIKFYRPNSIVENRYYELWNRTGEFLNGN